MSIWSAGPMEYVRQHYNVPAKRGRRVLYNGWPGRITSARHGLLRVTLDRGQKLIVHPTDEKLQYAKEPAAAGGGARE